MPTQLRTYTINRGQLDTFAREWQEKIRPLREKLGFSIPGAWLCRTTNQFLWLLAHPDPDAWERLDRAYFDAPERRAMQPDPARNIARMEQVFLDEVPPPA